MRIFPLFVIGGTVLTVSSCREEAAAPQGYQQGIPAVRVVTVQSTEAPLTLEQPGRLEAYRQAEVRARVSGIVMERPYEEGQDVEEGTPLFLIDPAPMQAAYDAAAASLQVAQTNFSLAVDKRERYEKLSSTNAISVRELQESVSEEKQAEAQIALAQANEDAAKLQLGYTTVSSPIKGRARRANVTEGALVGQDGATLLTTVEQISPIYVNFSQPVAEMMALRDSITQGTLEGVEQGKIKVKLTLGNGKEYSEVGSLLFSDLAVDPGTDTVAMRALFPNEDRSLLPGMYVKVSLEYATIKEAYLIPRVALVRTPQGAIVMTVNPEGVVSPVPVEANSMQGDQWLVTSGLQNGDRVIIENAGMMAPGSQVTVVTDEGQGTAAAPAEGASPEQAEQNPSGQAE